MLLDLYFATVFMVLVVLVRGLDQYAYCRRRIDRFRTRWEHRRRRAAAGAETGIVG
jgi:hypothetical protein